MIISADNEVAWYNNLIAEHESNAANAPENSGTRKAESVITDELKQMLYDRSLRFTVQQAMTLLCARLAMRLHTLRESTSFQSEKRTIYCRFLAKYAKIKRETPESIFYSVQQYVYSGSQISPVQGFCFGLFIQYCAGSNEYNTVQLLISQASIREWIIQHIDYYETIGNKFTYQQRQDAIDAFIYILGLFH